MKYLLDTHVFVWWSISPEKLSSKAISILQDPDNIIFLSLVSVWEMQIKSLLGKLSFPVPLAEVVFKQQANGIWLLPLTLSHIWRLENLPNYHRDPFDRLLISQTMVEQIPLVSNDSQLIQYPTQVVW
jgi:PIN domain nuclease of toxin-antitoxin system